MKDQEYQQWWQLHLRTSRGETLTPEEQARYQAGVEALDARQTDAAAPVASDRLRSMRAQIDALKAAEERLIEEQRHLEAEISELESRYQAATRRTVVPSPW